MDAYYWEFVKIFQKELMIIVLTYYQDQYIIKGILVFFLIFGYGMLALKTSPYMSKVLNFLDLESTFVCAVSLCGIVLIYECGKEGLTYLAVIFYLIIGIINFIFIIQMILVLIHGYVVKFEVPSILKCRLNSINSAPRSRRRNPISLSSTPG
jgi:hypothetical protein